VPSETTDGKVPEDRGDSLPQAHGDPATDLARENRTLVGQTLESSKHERQHRTAFSWVVTPVRPQIDGQVYPLGRRAPGTLRRVQITQA
jgi:hypothetical protein